eukprot:5443681-Pyramimonas_sp.AAC.1
MRRKPSGSDKILDKVTELRMLGHPRGYRALTCNCRPRIMQAKKNWNVVRGLAPVCNLPEDS